jgi:hypothetical protein
MCSPLKMDFDLLHRYVAMGRHSIVAVSEKPSTSLFAKSVVAFILSTKSQFDADTSHAATPSFSAPRQECLSMLGNCWEVKPYTFNAGYVRSSFERKWRKLTFNSDDIHWQIIRTPQPRKQNVISRPVRLPQHLARHLEYLGGVSRTMCLQCLQSTMTLF